MPMIYYGDEVGMTGGKDPDCRRGMLWDRSRWDMETWNHYRALLRIRRTHPAVTEGALIRQEAWDDLAMIRMDKQWQNQRLTILFHAADGSVHLPELSGQTDLITGTVFDGTLTGFRALAFVNPPA